MDNTQNKRLSAFTCILYFYLYRINAIIINIIIIIIIIIIGLVWMAHHPAVIPVIIA